MLVQVDLKIRELLSRLTHNQSSSMTAVLQRLAEKGKSAASRAEGAASSKGTGADAVKLRATVLKEVQAVLAFAIKTFPASVPVRLMTAWYLRGYRNNTYLAGQLVKVAKVGDAVLVCARRL